MWLQPYFAKCPPKSYKAVINAVSYSGFPASMCKKCLHSKNADSNMTEAC